jgi:hypothetical protein
MVHYRVHKGRPLYTTLSQTNLAHTLTRCFFRIKLNVILSPASDCESPKGSLFFRFPVKVFLHSSIRPPLPSYSSFTSFPSISYSPLFLNPLLLHLPLFSSTSYFLTFSPSLCFIFLPPSSLSFYDFSYSAFPLPFCLYLFLILEIGYPDRDFPKFS